jgi:ribosomal RNA-processing protein 1
MQTALADRLSEIMAAVPASVGALYFRIFVRTMRREWFGIDRHRMDKFMMLVRKLYAAHLRFLAATGWDTAVVTEFAEFWRAEVLLPSDTIAASGFAYHVADLVLSELGRVTAETGTPPPAAAVDALLEPFCAAAAATRDAVMVRRLEGGLWSGIAAELRTPADGDALRNLDAAALAERLFDLGK